MWEGRQDLFFCSVPGHLANATTDLMKLDHEEEPQLSEPYLSKQKKLMVRALPMSLPPSDMDSYGERPAYVSLSHRQGQLW